jgi:hypothetical protein
MQIMAVDEYKKPKYYKDLLIVVMKFNRFKKL